MARTEDNLTEIFQFVVGGVEIGQQVVAMAGPTCLKDLATALAQSGLRPEALLHSGRLVFLTAPESLSTLFKPGRPSKRGELRLNGPLVRWVSDWSWARADVNNVETILSYQRRVHSFIRSFNALSLCTVDCDSLSRSSLLAMMANHRRAARDGHPPLHATTRPSAHN